MSDKWGPWIEHDGKGCPVRGQYVRAVFELWPGQFEEGEGRAGSDGGWSWDWRWWRKVPPGLSCIASRVVRYRIRKPRGLTVLQDIAARVREPVDA